MPILNKFGTLEAEFYDGCGHGLGHYVNEPGVDPVIFLNKTLLEGDKVLQAIVYLRLLKFHNNLNEWELLVPITCCYEELPLLKPAPFRIEIFLDSTYMPDRHEWVRLVS